MTALIPDDSQLSERDSYTCGICSKKFDRRDLRNRHRRRCIRSISNPRKSKRKSCYACAASKLGCDLGLPTCSRCSLRKINCEYASGPGTWENKAPERANPDMGGMTMLGIESSTIEEDMANSRRSSVHIYDDPMRSNHWLPGSDMGDSPRLDGSINGSTAHASDTSSSHISNEDLLSAWAKVENMQHFWASDAVLQRALAEEGAMELPPDFILSEEFPFNESGALADPYSIAQLDSNLASFHPPTGEPDWANSLPGLSNEPPTASGFNPMRPLDLTGASTNTNMLPKVSTEPRGPTFNTGSGNNTSMLQKVPTESQVSTFNTIAWEPPLQREPHNFSGAEPEDKLASGLLAKPSRGAPVPPTTMVIDSPKGDSPAATFDPGNNLTLHPTDDISNQTNANKTPAQILFEFPQMMSRRGGNYPPFVHHWLYRCEEGDVQKPLAVAFCCVTAVNTAFPSGKGFVHTLMNAERDRLLKEFRLLRDTEVEMMAAVHAMCVYQIMGFFDESSSDAARFAELQQAFFLRMARRLVDLYMPQIRTAIDVNDLSESAWEKWTSAETVRRTFFLIHIINVVACRTEKQNPYFYEELDDNLVMNLPLPAPQSVWKANTAVEWQAAIEGAIRDGWQGNITASMALDEKSRKEYVATGSDWDLGIDTLVSGGKVPGGSFTDCRTASSLGFTRLLLHCIYQRRG